MKKLPITLCVITRNSADRIKEMVEKHRPFVSEVLIADQSSTDGTWDIAQEVADHAIQRRHKGTADPDRNWLFQQAKNEWILYLDDDEYLDEKCIEALPRLLKDNIDIYWLKETNLVDGIDIKEILGDDPHPRLFKKGSIRFPDQIHTYPEPANDVKVAFVDYSIIHDRTLEKIKESNRARDKIASPEQIQVQENFIKQVEDLLGKKSAFKEL